MYSLIKEQAFAGKKADFFFSLYCENGKSFLKLQEMYKDDFNFTGKEVSCRYYKILGSYNKYRLFAKYNRQIKKAQSMLKYKI